MTRTLFDGWALVRETWFETEDNAIKVGAAKAADKAKGRDRGKATKAADREAEA